MAKRRRPFVAVETDVAKDESFAVLGDVCGYNRDEALGRIIRLWAWCADRKLQDAPEGCPGYAVSEGVVMRFLGPAGVRGILGDGVAEFALGERWGDLIYLRGTDATVAARRSKIEGAVVGGETRAREAVATGARGPDGKYVVKPTICQPTHHPEPARPPSSTSVDPRSQIPDPNKECSPARDPALRVPDATLHSSPPPPPEPILTASRERVELKRRLIGRSWALGGEAFARVQASGIDPGAPNGWAGLPDASSPPMRNLSEILDGMLVGDRPDGAAVEAKIANRIAVAEAEARAMSPPSARYMTPARIWNRESFSIAVDLSPEQAAAPRPFQRAGPRGSASRAPERDPRVGQIQPHHPSEYNVPDGEMPL